MDRTIAAIVLAAGAGSRFAGTTHKLDAESGGSTVLRHAIDSAIASEIGPVIVVTRPDRPGLDTLPPKSSVTDTPLSAAPLIVVVNTEWERGQASSLRAGIDAATVAGAERVVVGLGDQPAIEPSAWRTVAAAGAEAPIAVAHYAATGRGHPVSLHRDVWALLPASGDAGARSLMRLHPELVREVPCDGSAADIDTLEDLERWQNNSSTSSP